MELSVVIAAGVFIVSLIALFLSSSAKYLSIREHETYTAFLTREMDLINNRLLLLEQTRPTTGELEARLQTGKFITNGRENK